MKQTDEQLVLRNLSGELGLFGRWRLRRRLAADPGLRSYTAALRRLQQEVRQQTLADIPATPRDVMAAILAMADHQRAVTPTGWRIPAWATAAAGLAVILGFGVYFTAQPARTSIAGGNMTISLPWEDTIDAQLAALKKDINQHSQTTATATNDTSELDALAELLAMNEGGTL